VKFGNYYHSRLTPGRRDRCLPLVRHLLGRPDLNNIQTVWAYQRIRPVFMEIFEQIPSLLFFTGD
jgi:hypothetical protein